MKRNKTKTQHTTIRKQTQIT